MKETLIVLAAVLIGAGIIVAVLDFRKTQPTSATPAIGISPALLGSPSQPSAGSGGFGGIQSPRSASAPSIPTIGSRTTVPTLAQQIALTDPGSVPCCSDVPSTYSGLCTDDAGSVTTFDAFRRGVVPVGQGPALPASLDPLSAASVLPSGVTPWSQADSACEVC